MKKEDRKQISLRLPPETLKALDERRKPQDISRDEWIRRAVDHCLSLPVRTPTP